MNGLRLFGPSILNGVGVVGGVLGFVAFFVPDIGQWMAESGSVGWLVASGVLIAYPAVYRFLGSQRDVALASERATQEADCDSDRRLLGTLFEGWSVNDRLHSYLAGGIDYRRLPAWVVTQLDEKQALWDTEPRRLKTAEAKVLTVSARDDDRVGCRR